MDSPGLQQVVVTSVADITIDLVSDNDEDEKEEDNEDFFDDSSSSDVDGDDQ